MLEKSIKVAGNNFYYRDSTFDSAIINANLGASVPEYKFPSLKPKVAFDIGANIGVTALVLTLTYPDAQVYAFEPQKDNFDLLKRNMEPYKNVHVFNYGLGSVTNESMQLFHSDNEYNLGGFSLYKPGTSDQFETVHIRSISDTLKDLNIDKIDVIKIDTEGSEYDILSSIDPNILQETDYIVGELHGTKDHETLSLLSSNFDLEFIKHHGIRIFMFSGINNRHYK